MVLVQSVFPQRLRHLFGCFFKIPTNKNKIKMIVPCVPRTFFYKIGLFLNHLIFIWACRRPILYNISHTPPSNLPTTILKFYSEKIRCFFLKIAPKVKKVSLLYKTPCINCILAQRIAKDRKKPTPLSISPIKYVVRFVFFLHYSVRNQFFVILFYLIFSLHILFSCSNQKRFWGCWAVSALKHTLRKWL